MSTERSKARCVEGAARCVEVSPSPRRVAEAEAGGEAGGEGGGEAGGEGDTGGNGQEPPPPPPLRAAAWGSQALHRLEVEAAVGAALLIERARLRELLQATPLQAEALGADPPQDPSQGASQGASQDPPQGWRADAPQAAAAESPPAPAPPPAAPPPPRQHTPADEPPVPTGAARAISAEMQTEMQTEMQAEMQAEMQTEMQTEMQAGARARARAGAELRRERGVSAALQARLDDLGVRFQRDLLLERRACSLLVRERTAALQAG